MSDPLTSDFGHPPSRGRLGAARRALSEWEGAPRCAPAPSPRSPLQVPITKAGLKAAGSSAAAHLARPHPVSPRQLNRVDGIARFLLGLGLAFALGLLLLAATEVQAQGNAPASAALGYDHARHLLNRTSFAAGEREIEDFAQLTREQAVDRLLSWVGPVATTPPPEWTASFVSPRAQLNQETMDREDVRRAFQQDQMRKGAELRSWWLTEMLTTRSPLTEKMTLFWHNHFVSAGAKVKSPTLLYRQNTLLRRHALGNFGTLLHAISKDPAMIVYLDGATNRKESPNENFAREVMELFTLGEGHYSERDIKEAARAFTGWSIDRDTGQFVFRRPLHDGGSKTVLGHTGHFDGDAVLDLLLGSPHTAEFITTKLWREFISPDPDPAEVKRLAKVFRDSRYELRPLLKAMLTSDAFYAPANRGALVKSPVDLVVGTLRQFQIQVHDPLPFALAMRQMGQDLFNPPNVKGWPGGDAWINTSTLLTRKQLLERVFRAGEAAAQPQPAALLGTAGGREGRSARTMAAGMPMDFDAGSWLQPFRTTDGDRRLARLLLPLAPVQATLAKADVAGLRELALDPAYQLK